MSEGHRRLRDEARGELALPFSDRALGKLSHKHVRKPLAFSWPLLPQQGVFGSQGPISFCATEKQPKAWRKTK